MSSDPNRFRPYRESLAATVARTGAIAVIVATIAMRVRLGHLPATSGEWHAWLAALAAAGWISLGGHWMELAYLNGLRPKIARRPDAALVLARLGIWLVGGTILFLLAAVTHSLLTFGGLPAHGQVAWALRFGGPTFVAIELFVHLLLLLAGRPSFWNLRG